jgi:segregation and condensation protein B
METEVSRPDETGSEHAAGDEMVAADVRFGEPAGDAEPDGAIADESVTTEEAPDLLAVLEGMLFAAGAPVPLVRLAEAADGADRGAIRRALRVLGERLETDGRGLRLAEVAGGFQLRTLPEHAHYIRRLLGGRPPRLSRAMLETLAIIAYKQPCTRPEIEMIRGVDVDAVVSTLLERRMIRLLGRKEAPGRPLLYGTTREFLEVFGLPDLDALPPLRDLGEIAAVLTDNDLSVTAAGVLPTETGAHDADATAGEDVGPDGPDERGEPRETHGQPEPD